MKRSLHLFGCVLVILLTMSQSFIGAYAGALRQVNLPPRVYAPVIMSITGTLVGRVTAEDTGLPLRGVAVQACRDDRTWYCEFSGEMHTMINGQYSFNLEPGHYELLFYRSASSEDYPGEKYKDKPLNAAKGDSITITQNTVTIIDVALAKGGKVAGVVTAEDTGLPLAGVDVSFVLICEPGSASQCGGWSTNTFTSASGTYSIGLPPGKYRMLFGSVDEYAGEKYQNKKLFEEGDLITVTANSTLRIDAALERAGKVIGMVTAEDTGLPLSDVRVRMCRINTASCDWGANDGYAFTQADGSYTVFAPPANYTMIFDGKGNYAGEKYLNKGLFEAGDVITITSNTTTTINASLARKP